MTAMTADIGRGGNVPPSAVSICNNMRFARAFFGAYRSQSASSETSTAAARKNHQ
jgi:hypothetical protein